MEATGSNVRYLSPSEFMCPGVKAIDFVAA
jgi:hypothetical protein